MVEYQEAIQSPHLCFADADLRGGTPTLDTLGLPQPITGGFASVYEVTGRSGRRWAVRCFLREFKDQSERYRHIGDHLRAAALPYTSQFEFQPQGILVQGHRFPILKMEWVRGTPLNEYIEGIRLSPAALAGLAQRWQKMLTDLKAKQTAHGDLQHGNVLVAPDGSLKLIDYDGMWVPALSGRGSHETGHSAYQSPRRTEHDFHKDIDDFAGGVILVAVLATTRRPELWDEFNNGDNILFRRDDFLDPAASRLFRSLLALPDNDIRGKVRGLIRACGFDPDRVKPATLSAGVVTAGGEDSWLSDHIPGIVRAVVNTSPKFVFAFAQSWERPGFATIQRVRKEPVYVTRIKMRQEPVYRTQVRHRTEPVWETHTRMVRLTVPAANTGIGKAFRSFFGMPQTVEVERPEQYQVQIGTRQVAEEYQEQVGTRDVLDGTHQVQTGYRDVIETTNEKQHGHNYPLRAVGMTRDGDCIASGDEAGFVVLWRGKDGSRITSFRGFNGAVTGVAGVGTGLVAASGDKEVRLWNVSGLAVHTFTNQLNSYVNGVAASPDGKLVAGALGMLQLLVWDVAAKKQVARLRAHRRKVLCAAFGSSNDVLISGSEDMSVKVWDVRRERCVHTLHGHTGAVVCVALAPNNKLAASGGRDGLLILWDPVTGKQTLRSAAHTDGVTGVAFSPDSRGLITCGRDGRFRCWDVKTGKVITEYPTQQRALAGLALEPKGSRLAACGVKSVCVWDNRQTAKP
jgi:hypothetical protein